MISTIRKQPRLKAILATYRDYGNREVRSNARLKYLVHKLGINKYRDLVHAYLPEPWIEPWRELPPWEYTDWMGWHEQGDGKLFLGVPIDSGRVRDFVGGPQIKTALRKIVDRWEYDLILSPTQSRRAAAQLGRAELLAKKRHTDRLQNPAKLRRFRIGGGIGAG